MKTLYCIVSHCHPETEVFHIYTIYGTQHAHCTYHMCPCDGQLCGCTLWYLIHHNAGRWEGHWGQDGRYHHGNTCWAHLHVPVFTYVVAFPAQLMATTAMEKAVSLGKPANLVDVRLVDKLPVPIRVMVYWAGLPPLGVHMTIRSDSPGVTETEGWPRGAGVVWIWKIIACCSKVVKQRIQVCCQGTVHVHHAETYMYIRMGGEGHLGQMPPYGNE